MTKNQNAALAEMLVIDEVAAICRVSNRTVRRWVKARDLPAVLLGGLVRIRPKDLEIFIRDRLTR